jgi:hypothetical protein
MTYKIRNRFASIATNDPKNDPPPRVMLERTVRDGRVVWVSTDNPETVIVDGRTAKQADATLRNACADQGKELRMIAYGIHTLNISA